MAYNKNEAKITKISHEIRSLKEKQQRIIDEMGFQNACTYPSYLALSSRIEQLEKERISLKYDLEKDNEMDENEFENSNDEYKLDIFRDIKKRYKSQNHKWDRFLNRIQGKAPNWDRIKKYSEEELQFLLDASYGDTDWQKERNQKIEDDLNFDSLSDSKMTRKKLNKKIWNQFNIVLNSRNKLKQYMEIEETMGKTL